MYVLGATSAPDRHAFERHLGACADCQHELIAVAGLPGLLARVNPSLAGGGDDGIPL